MDAEKTGRFIARLRKEKHLTQTQLAELLHVSDKAVSRWETGKGFPDIRSIEDISETLGVSIAELLKGERIPAQVTKEEADALATDTILFLRRIMRRKEVWNLVTGFLIILIFLTVLIVHLTSPIYIRNAENALSVETLSDGRVLAVLRENVAGYEIDKLNIPKLNMPDDAYKETDISCYETRWNQLTGKKQESAVLLGDADEVGRLYYYPSDTGNQLLYSNGDDETLEGSVTLPRLVYNYWIVIGLAASVLGFIAYMILRNRYFSRVILRAVMIPAAFTVSTLLVLAGGYDQVYNARFYFSGILLLAAFLYALFLTVDSKRRRGDGNGNGQA